MFLLEQALIDASSSDWISELFILVAWPSEKLSISNGRMFDLVTTIVQSAVNPFL